MTIEQLRATYDGGPNLMARHRGVAMKTTIRSKSRVFSMRLCPSPRWSIVIATGCTLLVTALGSDPVQKEQRSAESKEFVLFDGKTLDGWKKTDFAHTGEVKVEDGQILMNAGRTMTGITTTRPSLPRSNYELSYEAMRLSGGDFFAAATFPVGESFVTLVNGGWGGNVTGLSSLDGMDASENETTRSVKYQDKTWYKFRVRVTDEVIRCWIDGKPVVSVNHKDKQVRTRIETRANEPLGFATWETSGAVRNIVIRTLTSAEVVATNKPQG
jgi:hypothetical protein